MFLTKVRSFLANVSSNIFQSWFFLSGIPVTYILEHLTLFYILLSLCLPFKLFFNFCFLRLFIISFDVFSSSLTLYLYSKLPWRLFSEFSCQMYCSVFEFLFFLFIVLFLCWVSPIYVFMNAIFSFKSLNILIMVTLKLLSAHYNI